jgi:hypothetical protein
VSGLRLNEGNMDGANEFPGGEVEKPVARAIIAIANEHAAEGFGRKFVAIAILQTEVSRATKDLNVCEVGRDAMEKGVRNTARPGGRSGRGKAIAKVDRRTHGKAPILGRAVCVLEHGGGGIRKGGPLAFHLGELVMSVRGGELGCISQGGDHGAASCIKVVRITIELDRGPKGTSRVQAGVQVPDVCESGRKCGDNSFLGCEGKEPDVVGIVINYTEEVFCSPRPSLL